MSDELTEQVGKTIDTALATERIEDGQEWRDWAQPSIKGGTGWAHKWTRKLEAWKRVSAVHG
eukprot:6037227-Pyramimonas_sp.AAC.1